MGMRVSLYENKNVMTPVNGLFNRLLMMCFKLKCIIIKLKRSSHKIF
jgi:hypothetical protein